MSVRYYGGLPTGLGNDAGVLAGSPSFQIGPRSPFKGMSQEELNKLKEWDSRPGDLQKYYEQQNRPGPQLPFAGFPGAIGNMEGLIAQAQPKQTLKELIGNREGGMSDIPGDVRIRQDTQFLPYDPGNYTQNNRSNPLRNYGWPYGMPQGMDSGIRPYFGRYQGPGLQGEVGTGAI